MVTDDQVQMRQEACSRPGKLLCMPRWGDHMGCALRLEGATGEREEGTSRRPKSHASLKDLSNSRKPLKDVKRGIAVLCQLSAVVSPMNGVCPGRGQGWLAG